MTTRRKTLGAFAATILIATAAKTSGAASSNQGDSQMNPPHNPKRNYFFAYAGNTSVSGDANIGIGEISLYSLTTGFNNVAVGDQVMRSHTTGINNVGVGALAMANSVSCVDCTVVGVGALQSATLGVGTTAMGRLSCNSLLNAGNNTAYGDSTFRFLQSGSLNVSVGYRSAETLVGGTGNVAVGAQAAISVENGNDNVFLGYLSGWQERQAKSINNSIAIGARTFTTKSNQVVIGTEETEEIVLGGVSMTPGQLRQLLALLEES